MPSRLRTFLGDRKVLGFAFLILLFAVSTIYTTQPFVSSPGKNLAPSVDASALREDVNHLAGSSRVYSDPSGLDEVAAWIHTRFETCGAAVKDQVYGAHGRVYRNVIADFGPSSGPVTVVGAHYDTCGPRPGADDNASGLASLLALAKMLQANPPAQPVELVAYTLEEPPFFRSADMGSVRHAQALKASGRKVRGVFVLEMIGTFTDEDDTQGYPLPGMSLLYGGRGDYLAVVGSVGEGALVRKVKAAFRSASDLSVKSINAPSAIEGIDFSDHRSYWAEGLPAIMFTDTAFYRNRRYHTAADTPERLDYTRMAQAVQGVYGVVRKFSGP